MKASKLKISQAVSRSFGYVVICALIIVAIFIVVLDVLKYVFGIDPVREELDRLEQMKLAKRRHRPILLRFIYVNAP